MIQSKSEKKIQANKLSFRHHRWAEYSNYLNFFWWESYSSSTTFLCLLSGPASARWSLVDPNTCVPHKQNPIIHLHLYRQEFTNNNNNKHQQQRIQLLSPIYSSGINAAIANTVLFQDKQSNLWLTQLEQRHSVWQKLRRASHDAGSYPPRPTTMNACSLPASIFAVTLLHCPTMQYHYACQGCLCVYNTLNISFALVI